MRDACAAFMATILNWMWITKRREDEQPDQLSEAIVAYSQFRRLLSQRGYETASIKLTTAGLTELVQPGNHFSRQAARWRIPPAALERGFGLYGVQTKAMREKLSTPRPTCWQQPQYGFAIGQVDGQASQ